MARSRASTWLPDREYGDAQHTSVAGRPEYAETLEQIQRKELTGEGAMAAWRAAVLLQIPIF